jgi:hypothetical protein
MKMMVSSAGGANTHFLADSNAQKQIWCERRAGGIEPTIFGVFARRMASPIVARSRGRMAFTRASVGTTFW